MKWLKVERGGMLWKILFIVLGAVVGVAAYSLYETFIISLAPFLVVLNVFVIVLVYAFLHLHYKMKKDSVIGAAVKSMEAIKSNAGITDTDFPNDFLPLSHAIEGLSEHIKNKEQVRSDILNMVNSVATNIELEKLLNALMPKLINFSGSTWGAFYLANNATGKLEIKSSLGFSSSIYTEFDIDIGEGLIGSSVTTQEIKIIKDLPDDTVYTTRTFLGKIKPKNIMSVPIVNQDRLLGVLVLASIYEYTADHIEIVEMTKYFIGAAIGNSVIYEQTKRLSSELQFQNRLIHDLNTELERKVSDTSSATDSVFDKIEDYAVYSLDAALNIISWNAGAERLFGYTHDDVLGRHVGILFRGAENIEDSVNARVDRVSRLSRYTERKRRKRKDGSAFFAEITVVGRFDDNGELNGYTAVIKDISDFKHTSDALEREKDTNKRIVMLSDSAIVRIDEDGTINLANAAAEKFLRDNWDSFGVGVLSGVQGLNLYSFFREYEVLGEFVPLGRQFLRRTFITMLGKPVEITAIEANGTEGKTGAILVMLKEEAP